MNKKALDKWKNLFLKSINKIPKDCTISLSGGMDSSSIVYGLIELDKKPESCITFQLQDYDSTDLKFTKKICNYYDIPLIIAKMPVRKQKDLRKEVKEVVRDLGYSRQIDVQCAHAFTYMLPKLKNKNLVLGFFTTLHYSGMSTTSLMMYRKYKKGYLTLSEYKKAYNKKRNMKPNDNNYLLTKYIENKNIKVWNPLLDEDLIKYSSRFIFMDFNENDEGKLRLKYFLYKMFKKHFDVIGNSNHIKNFHVEVGLKKYHNDVLLSGTHFKRTIGIYNELLREIQDEALSFSLRSQ